jgi:hypothetical protein
MNNGELQIDVELADAKKMAFVCDPASGAILKETSPLAGKHCKQAATLANVVEVIDCATGKDGTTWSVDALTGGGPRQVRQLTRGHEVLRRLEYVADDPQPAQIEASTTEEKIFLVEQNHLLQRFRGLGLVQTRTAGAEGPVSDWKSLFDKKIIEHQNFVIANGKPIASSPAPQSGPEKLTQTLRPNPLQHDQPGKVDLAVDKDADGSYLKTTDGLPLRTISDTPNLTRTLLVPLFAAGVIASALAPRLRSISSWSSACRRKKTKAAIPPSTRVMAAAKPHVMRKRRERPASGGLVSTGLREAPVGGSPPSSLGCPVIGDSVADAADGLQRCPPERPVDL